MSTGGVQRLLALPPIPESARAARRFVGEVLQAARAEEFLDSAQLLTSELVTNGIVHAHTDLRVVIEATPTWVRVEICDDNPMLPSQREYDDDASTGRGLGLVEVIADEFGVEAVGTGKRVWFRLGAVPGARFDQLEPPTGADSSAPITVIDLLGLPVALYCVWQQHAEALLREATLATFDENDATSASGPVVTSPLAGHALSALADAAHDIFALRDADVMTADVSVAIVSDAVPGFVLLRDALGRATAMSRAGQLLVPPSLPEIAALRNWVCEEVTHQASGLPPTQWVGLENDEAEPARVSESTLADVRGATEALVAADASNRIVAVSAAAEQLLGWAAADLEGKRLVTIIPPRLRDRHVAGFTRHLLDGTSAIIGQPMTVPAIRRDGVEVDVVLLIERRADPLTRAVFVATLSPA
ncbi:MAG: hypothetical protein QOF18_2990 [Frankiaceae bacterium]|nr:hypothetical protein [Frankiaceae bacterium]